MNRKIAGYVFLAIFVSYFAVVMVATFSPVLARLGTTWLLVISEGIIVLPAIVIYCFIAKKVSFAEAFGFKKIKLSTAAAVLLFGLLIMPLGTLMNAISMLVVDNIFIESSSIMLGLPFPVMFLILAVYGPLCEELAFRGIILKSFDFEESGWKALVVSGLMFGLMHMNLNQFMYAFVLGVAFAMVAEATGSILSSFLCHFLFNAINAIGLYIVNKVIPGYYQSAAVTESLTKDKLLMSIGVYFNIALVTTVLAGLLLKWIATREGNPDFYKKLKGNGKQVFSVVLVIAIALYVIYIGFDTYTILMNKR